MGYKWEMGNIKNLWTLPGNAGDARAKSHLGHE
jgi:hypothetical protein